MQQFSPPKRQGKPQGYLDCHRPQTLAFDEDGLSDRRRDDWLKRQDVTELHLGDSEVLSQTEAVLERIWREMLALWQRAKSMRASNRGGTRLVAAALPPASHRLLPCSGGKGQGEGRGGSRRKNVRVNLAWEAAPHPAFFPSPPKGEGKKSETPGDEAPSRVRTAAIRNLREMPAFSEETINETKRSNGLHGRSRASSEARPKSGGG